VIFISGKCEVLLVLGSLIQGRNEIPVAPAAYFTGCYRLRPRSRGHGVWYLVRIAMVMGSSCMVAFHGTALIFTGK
jgi:hypothetical protein